MEVVVVENELSIPVKSLVLRGCSRGPAGAMAAIGSLGAGPVAAARHVAGREFQRQAAGPAVCQRLHRRGLPQGPAGARPAASFRAASRASCASITPTAAKAPRRWPAIFRISRGAPPRSLARRARASLRPRQPRPRLPCRTGARAPSQSRHRAKRARRARSPVAGAPAPPRGPTRIPLPPRRLRRSPHRQPLSPIPPPEPSAAVTRPRQPRLRFRRPAGARGGARSTARAAAATDRSSSTSSTSVCLMKFGVFPR